MTPEQREWILTRKSIELLSEDGGLEDWSRVRDRAKRLLEVGRTSEAEHYLNEICEAVKSARRRERV